MAGGSDPHGHLRDPRASLRVCGATLTLPDPVGVVDVPAVDAATWLDQLMAHPSRMGALGVLGSEDRFRTWKAMIRGQLLVPGLESALGDMITVVSGRPWWETIMIVAVAVASWDETVGGGLATKGINPVGMPLGAWLDAAWLVEREATGSEEQLANLVAKVRTRPLEPGDEDGMDVEEFEQAMAAWA